MEEYKKIIIDSVTKFLPSCEIYLFGSRARKTHFLDNGAPIETETFAITDAIDQWKS